MRGRVLIASLLAAAFAAAPAQARFDGTLAYGVLAEGSVFTVRPDGTGTAQVLRDAEWTELSRDGRRLAYGSDYGNRGLWVARADGSHRRRVVDPRSRAIEGERGYQTWTPTWAPGGRRLAFAALWEVQGSDDEGELEVGEEWRVVSVGAAGGALRVLAHGHDPAWAPKGGLIAYAGDDNRIAVVRSDGSGRRTLLGRSRRYRSDLEFSPDGRRLLYDENGRLVVLDLRTRRRAVIVRRRHAEATWAPAGGWIAYAHDRPVPDGERTPPTEIRVVRRTGSGDRLLFSLPFDEDDGTWADSLSWR